MEGQYFLCPAISIQKKIMQSVIIYSLWTLFTDKYSASNCIVLINMTGHKYQFPPAQNQVLELRKKWLIYVQDRENTSQIWLLIGQWREKIMPYSNIRLLLWHYPLWRWRISLQYFPQLRRSLWKICPAGLLDLLGKTKLLHWSSQTSTFPLKSTWRGRQKGWKIGA